MFSHPLLCRFTQKLCVGVYVQGVFVCVKVSECGCLTNLISHSSGCLSKSCLPLALPTLTGGPEEYVLYPVALVV